MQNKNKTLARVSQVLVANIYLFFVYFNLFNYWMSGNHLRERDTMLSITEKHVPFCHSFHTFLSFLLGKSTYLD